MEPVRLRRVLLSGFPGMSSLHALNRKHGFAIGQPADKAQLQDLEVLRLCGRGLPTDAWNGLPAQVQLLSGTGGRATVCSQRLVQAVVPLRSATRLHGKATLGGVVEEMVPLWQAAIQAAFGSKSTLHLSTQAEALGLGPAALHGLPEGETSDADSFDLESEDEAAAPSAAGTSGGFMKATRVLSGPLQATPGLHNPVFQKLAAQVGGKKMPRRLSWTKSHREGDDTSGMRPPVKKRIARGK